MRRLIAAAAILAVVFVIGCQDTKKVTELQGQVDKQTQQITEMEGTVVKLTAERDSLAKLVTDLMAKMPPAKGTKPPTGTQPPATKKVNPPVKK